MRSPPCGTSCSEDNGVEIGKYLNKGLWGLADKALPVAYGVAYVLLVIRVLPDEEFGNFVLIQEVFLAISALATAFALQPLLKFASEARRDDTGVVSASFLLHGIFIVVSSLLVVAFAGPAADVLNSAGLAPLLRLVPAMLAASLFRNFTMALLQAEFRIREVFWMDALHFLGTPFLVWVVSRLHQFDTALDLVYINIISLSCSSIAGVWFARKWLPETLQRPGGGMERVWHFGKYSFGTTVSTMFSTKADSFILSAFTGPVQVAVYNSAKVFVRIYEMMNQVVQMFVLPAASRLSSQGEGGSLKVMTEKAILFLTVGLLPVTAVFLLFPDTLVGILYGGRYVEAAGILRVFSLLTFVVPLSAVGMNILMGLGHVRALFILNLQILVASLVAFALCIPRGEALGAGIGYVAAATFGAIVAGRTLAKYVPFTAGEVFLRLRDITGFLRKQFRH